ncbi:MAG: DNA polymerase III subunit alpha, partial [Candidatus Portiera sp.]|nr:DNA polymerase III subunit alpha [Portiera sp.]
RERKPHPYLPQQFMKSPQEMEKLFADIPEAIENTYYAAQRCNFIIEPQQNLPNYPFSKGKSKKEMLGDLAHEGMVTLHGDAWSTLEDGEYKKRLDLELKVIDDMNYNDYFLIVCDFVNWAKNNDIPVGPGRGSGGGSLVACATGITALDPIKHNLLFERFLNHERNSMPDFDIDVCQDRRGEVIDYLQTAYGRENAVQIVSFGTMGAKSVARDVCRVLGKPYGLGEKISRMIPDGADAAQMKDALKEFTESDEEARQVVELALKLEGQVRQTGLHAAGVVIAPGAVKDYCPIFQDDDGKMICQYDKDDLEVVGLVKFDVLGLRNLTIIQETLRLIKEVDGQDLDMNLVPYNDEKTMQSICQGNTYAVFQLESSGMRDVARRMEPKLFEDIVALIALYRPGPMQLIDEFISNKKTLEEGGQITYPDDILEDILRPTYGIAVYQEQVMQMAQRLADFSLAQADILRHAMGKKKKDVMEQQREAFVAGAMNKGYEKNQSEKFFKTIETFAGYGFNRAHSVGYGVLAYWTAYLKMHYKNHFLASNMSSEVNNTDKLAKLAEECRKLSIEIRCPDINRGGCRFQLSKVDGKADDKGNNKVDGKVDDKGENKKQDKYFIDYSLAAIKGVGLGVAQVIVAERQKRPYNDFLDFCGRIPPKMLNHNTLKALIKAGCFRGIETSYSSLYNSIEQGVQVSKKKFEERTEGLGDMFGEKFNKLITPRHNQKIEWSKLRIANAEYQSLGFYLRHNTFDLHKEELRKYISTNIDELKLRQDMTICGRIYGIGANFNNNGKKIYHWRLIDDSGEVQVRCFEENLQGQDWKLKNDNIIAVQGKLTSFDGTSRGRQSFMAAKVYDMGELRANHCKEIRISSDAQSLDDNTLEKLEIVAMNYQDTKGLPVKIHITDRQSNSEFDVHIMPKSKVLPSNLFIEELDEFMPAAQVNFA